MLIVSCKKYIIIQGLMDTTNPLIVGHSFGASTAIRTLSEDKRFRFVYNSFHNLCHGFLSILSKSAENNAKFGQ